MYPLKIAVFFGELVRLVEVGGIGDFCSFWGILGDKSKGLWVEGAEIKVW